jgi:hypothetical protein
MESLIICLCTGPKQISKHLTMLSKHDAFTNGNAKWLIITKKHDIERASIAPTIWSRKRPAEYINNAYWKSPWDEKIWLMTLWIYDTSWGSTAITSLRKLLKLWPWVVVGINHGSLKTMSSKSSLSLNSWIILDKDSRNTLTHRRRSLSGPPSHSWSSAY